jgi:holin-like protein
MQALIGFTLLLLFQVFGEALSWVLPLNLPGPVLGLLMLWPSLANTWILAHVRAVAEFLLANLSLLFVPVGVGVIIHLDILAPIWWQIGLVLLLSTLIGLIVTVAVLAGLSQPGDGDG